jgi:hypothetical protein
MTIKIVQHLEQEMAAAHEAGDDHAFTVARNRRQAVWNYRDGNADLGKTQYLLGKMQPARKDDEGKVLVAADTACEVCTAWDGDVLEPEPVARRAGR